MSHDARGVASWRAGSTICLFEVLRNGLGVSGRERRLIKVKASSTCTCMTLLSTPSAEGTVHEQVHLPRGLAGSFETAQMDQLHE